MTPLKIISIIAFLIMLVGFLCRRRRKIHIPSMIAAFALDMALVAYIELTRHAIEQATSSPGPLMTVHIIISVLVVLLYFWQICTGIGKVRGRRHPSHGHTGLSLLILRFLNLVTSFMVTGANT
jgi:hypothetical protein